MNRFGRDELEWQELLDSATDQLKTLARSQLLTTYGELNASLAHDTGLAAFDLGTEGAGTHSASSSETSPARTTPPAGYSSPHCVATRAVWTWAAASSSSRLSSGC